MLYTGDKVSSSIFCCLWVCQASVTPDQISTFSNIYWHTSPLLTLYHLIPSSTNLYWPSTSQYRHILTQYHQVPLIIRHLVRHSLANWLISLLTTHFMSHAQYTWFSFDCIQVISMVYVATIDFYPATVLFNRNLFTPLRQPPIDRQFSGLSDECWRVGHRPSPHPLHL